MKNLRRNFERFCYRHHDAGIRNLMLYVALGNVVVYIFSMIDPSGALIGALTFDSSKILHGQIWRLFSYVLIPDSGGSRALGVLLLAIMLFFFYQIGRILENRWGVFKFNLYYLTGVVIADIAAFLLGVGATAYYLNLSLILAFATLSPEDRVLLLFFIPLKMKWLAWFYFGITIYDLIVIPFPYNLFPIFALLNYFLFFGSEIKYVLPNFVRFRRTGPARGYKKPPLKKSVQANPNWAAGYKSADGQKPYHHKCTVCGRTDADYPELEFRYCSKCNGYYCYCMDHINNHVHIQ